MCSAITAQSNGYCHHGADRGCRGVLQEPFRRCHRNGHERDRLESDNVSLTARAAVAGRRCRAAAHHLAVYLYAAYWVILDNIRPMKPAAERSVAASDAASATPANGEASAKETVKVEINAPLCHGRYDRRARQNFVAKEVLQDRRRRRELSPRRLDLHCVKSPDPLAFMLRPNANSLNRHRDRLSRPSVRSHEAVKGDAIAKDRDFE